MTNRQIPVSDNDRLELLYRLTQAFNSSLDLVEVLNRVMDEVISVLHAERGFVMLLDNPDKKCSPSEPGSFGFRVARGMDQKTIEDPQFQISRTVVEKVTQEGKPVLTTDAQSDTRFSTHTSVMILGLRSILCAPLIVKDKLLGVIYVDNRWHTGVFTLTELDLLTAIASSAAIAIENARLYQVAVDKGRMERELHMARKVQASLLPQQKPELIGWEFADRWEPAREVGGDYYDYIPIKEGCLGVLIADVTDKGMPAALFMASVRSIMRARMPDALSPAEGMTKVNQFLCAESEDGLFVSMFYAQIDLTQGEVTYVNAGHNPPLLYQRLGQDQNFRLIKLSCTGMQLGVEPDASYSQNSISLNPGDFILLYTDGVTEAIDHQNDEFGMERLQKTVVTSPYSSANDLLFSVQQAIDDFTGPTTPFDDITMLVVKRT
jgi:sigma-B regulation protein RsbU (phosphoserine phosphatase)